MLLRDMIEMYVQLKFQLDVLFVCIFIPLYFS
jgi:hypothetical protein